MSTSEPPPRFPNISVCNERVKGGQGKAGYYSLRIFGSARLAAWTGAESQPVRKALNTRTAWVNKSGRSRGKSELDNKVLSLCLLIKLRTMAGTEVGARKSNGLNKHHYLSRSPPAQFTGGQTLWPGSDSPYKNHYNNYKITLDDVWWVWRKPTVEKSIRLLHCRERNKSCVWKSKCAATTRSLTKNNSGSLWAHNIRTPVKFPWRSKSPDSQHSSNYTMLITPSAT